MSDEFENKVTTEVIKISKSLHGFREDEALSITLSILINILVNSKHKHEAFVAAVECLETALNIVNGSDTPDNVILKEVTEKCPLEK